MTIEPNGYIGWLSPEIQQMILENLTVQDLKALAATREENKQGVEYYIAQRRETLFRTFVEDVNGWSNVMERTGTVISGSTALGLVQAKAQSVVAADMDVYVTEAFEKQILDHLKEKEGYGGVKEIVCKRD